jgi:quercetin dioxygenase-like cupin family protein
MSFITMRELPVLVRKPGWRGRFFDSPSMSFVQYEFDAGAPIHEHFHPQEEVWQIIEGELDITIDGVTRRAGPGSAAIVPGTTKHSVVAVTDGRVFIVDYPLREIPKA